MTNYYEEDGKIVFTREYHLKRGYCCDSGCRHCPYKKDKKQYNLDDRILWAGLIMFHIILACIKGDWSNPYRVLTITVAFLIIILQTVFKKK